MRARILATLVVPLAVTAGSVVAGSRSQPAVASPHSDVRNAVAVAQSRGVHAGVAVLDTRDGTVWLGGEHSRTFSSASVVKVMIAARLLVSGQMRGDTAKLAVEMISRSDDGAANALYGLVGGDSLINWVKAHYNVPFLGDPPSPPGRWGNTRITPRGIVHLYARLKADPTVGQWLLQAMRRATPNGSDGQFQHFGIPAATRDFAVKQGWNCCDAGVATFNSTGYVVGDRFAVALLVDGAPHTYGTRLMQTLDAMAKALLRGGRIDRPLPAPAPKPAQREHCKSLRRGPPAPPAERCRQT
jgi:Beta-lactamase enzyme family